MSAHGVVARRQRSVTERFWEKVEKVPFETCWLWTGAAKPSRGGLLYGHLSRGRRGDGHVYAHRLSYEIHRGVIPPGMEVDHLCRNTLCVNPDHLEVVTPQINTLRSESVSGRAARRTHCPQGHAYTKDNLLRDASRKCKTCHRDGERRRRARRAM